jgi:hypothetical protein
MFNCMLEVVSIATYAAQTLLFREGYSPKLGFFFQIGLTGLG